MRLQTAQTERMVPLDFLPTLVQDGLTGRADRLARSRRLSSRRRRT